jgi:hypothetical protein
MLNKIISILLFITNIYSFSAFDLIGKEIITEDYHFRLGTNVSNLNCEKSLMCISNTLSEKGGYYLDENMLLLKWEETFLCWTNFAINNNIITAYKKEKLVVIEIK